LQDIASFERYILEELYVRCVTITSDKKKYGVTLRAEPDHKTIMRNYRQYTGNYIVA